MAKTAEEMLAESGAVQGDVDLPTTAESHDEERANRKHRLAGALRIFGKLGLAEGVAGHITVRDPEHTDSFWVNPFGRSFRYLLPADLIRVSHDGEVVEGSGALNTAAFAIHSQIHEARPDVIAAAHCHAMFGKTFSTLGRPLDPISQDAAMFFNDVALCADDGGAIVLETSGGKAIAAALGDKKAVLHQNHGAITVGGSVDAAAWWFVALERACQSQLVAEAAGTPILVSPEAAQLSYDASGSDIAGWFQFQALWEELLASDPDFPREPVVK